MRCVSLGFAKPRIPGVKGVGCSGDFGTGGRRSRSLVQGFFSDAGTPATRVLGGTSRVTTDPAPVIDAFPTGTGTTSMVSLPIFTSPGPETIGYRKGRYPVGSPNTAPPRSVPAAAGVPAIESLGIARDVAPFVVVLP